MAVVISLDAGTTGVRTMAVAEDGRVLAACYREFPQYFPRPGWVEHDAEEIWEAVVATLGEVLARVRAPVAAIGITNQRETTVVWDRRSGRPRHRAVVWQDRRTAGICEELTRGGHLERVRSATGLVLDPYFSATKLAWILGPGGVEADADTAFGTVDSWLLWRLSGGRAHLTDTTNAARTLLFDIDLLTWDPGLAELFGVPLSVLPEIGPSSGRLATTAAGVAPGLPAGVPVSGVAGDQQAALFGQACFEAGMTKNTYGTGSFVLMNVGPERPPPVDGLLTTVAWSIGGVDAPSTRYALEGAIFVTGAAIQWLRDGLGLISEAAEIGPLAATVADTGGAFFVPALTGLGSPWWDPHARGTMVGLTRGVGRAHLARAAVEAMAFQTADVVHSMSEASGHDVAELRVDGGASVMDLLLQFQADLLGVPVRRTAVSDTTALGAAYLAGLAEGVWGSLGEIASLWREDATARPTAGSPAAAAYAGWTRAVARTVGWAG
jgi:glycerol kinase